MENKTVAVSCPSCQKSLKLTHPITPGKSLRCPSCNEVFRAPDSEQGTATTIRRSATQPETLTPAATGENRSLILAIYFGGAAILLAAAIIGGAMMFGGGGGDGEPSKQVADNSPTKDDQGPADAKTPGKEVVSGEKEKSDGKEKSTGPDPSSTGTDNQPKTNDKAEPKTDEDPNRPGKTDEVKNPEGKANPDLDPNRPKDFPDVSNEKLAERPIGRIEDLPRMFNNPNNFSGGFQRPIIIIRQVPVFINANTNANAANTNKKPVVSVALNPPPAGVLLIDHQANPGLTAPLNITLTGTPKTAITVTVTTPTGITASQSTVTFPANAAPTAQVVTLSGNATTFGGAQSRLLNVKLSAAGNGLVAGGTLTVPVRVIRRTRFLTNSGFVFFRGDILNAASKPNWFILIPPALPVFPVATATPTPVYYTNTHVEIVLTASLGAPVNLPVGTRIRFGGPATLVENAPGSNTYVPNAFLAGSWR